MTQVIDTPAQIGILGDGLAAVEAALYGRYLGYAVQVFSVGELIGPCEKAANTTLELTFRQLTTPLGIAAIDAQFDDFRWPDLDTRPTMAELVDRYLAPLTKTDLMRGVATPNARLANAPKSMLAEFERDSVEDEDTDELKALWQLDIESPDGRRTVEVGAVLEFSDQETFATPLCAIDGVNWFRLSTGAASSPLTLDSPRVWSAIRDVYAQIVGRPSLNLYATFQSRD